MLNCSKKQKKKKNSDMTTQPKSFESRETSKTRGEKFHTDDVISTQIVVVSLNGLKGHVMNN
jgi:hypothetical protein